VGRKSTEVNDVIKQLQNFWWNRQDMSPTQLRCVAKMGILVMTGSKLICQKQEDVQ